MLNHEEPSSAPPEFIPLAMTDAATSERAASSGTAERIGSEAPSTTSVPATDRAETSATGDVAMPAGDPGMVQTVAAPEEEDEGAPMHDPVLPFADHHVPEYSRRVI